MLGIGVIIVVLIIYIYYLQYHKITTEEKLFVDDFTKHDFLKTGDMILFKAYNNFNSLFHGNYFGHIGIVYIDKNNQPMLFEANGIERVPLLNHHSKNGVFLTPLADRIKKYKGRVFWKPLKIPLSKDILLDFDNFVDYCLNNFTYNYSVVSSGIYRGLGLQRCTKNTDCGQIVFLSLIKLGLLPIEEYDKPRFHHLKFVCNIEKLQNNQYLDLVEVIDHPFAY